MQKNIINIGIASDHAGFEIKEAIKKELSNRGITLRDYGTHSTDSMDYPDVAHPLALAVERGEHNFGIALCGSGNGISMTLNKHQQIRAALCWTPQIATLARSHNNANILTIPARFVSKEEALQIVDEFLNTNFEGGRHLNRVNKIACQ